MTVNLYQMWVAPAHRGVGIGAMLLERVVDWARNMGRRQVTLGATHGDNAASRLYARAGFVPVGDPEPLRPDSDLKRQVMRLNL